MTFTATLHPAYVGAFSAIHFDLHRVGESVAERFDLHAYEKGSNSYTVKGRLTFLFFFRSLVESGNRGTAPMPTRPPRILKSVGVDIIATEPGDGALGVLTIDSDRGIVEYIISTESAQVLRTAIDQFQEYGKAVFGASQPKPQQRAQTLTVPVSPASVTVGDTEIDGQRVGVLQIKSEDGREVSLVLDEGQAEFVIHAATQLQALLNPTKQ